MNKNTFAGAVIYTRVSTGEQAEHGTSLESQRDACRAKAAALGLPVVAEYQDPGKSGASLLLRPGIRAALADIQAGRAGTLICANLSRYSRETEHQQSMRKTVRNAGGRLVFCDMDFADTPEGDLAFGIMGTFAQYERQVIKERTMKGKRRRAEEGQQPQRSRPPYGYHIVTNAEVAARLHPAAMRGHYIIVEETAAVVRRLFTEYVDGLSTLPKLTRELNREGTPTPGNGRLWQHPTLRLILSNPVYKGQPVSGRQKCSTDESRLGQRHKLTGRLIATPEVRTLVAEADRLTLSAPPLVTEALWDAAQRRLEENRTFLKGNPRRIQMLSGRTVCPHCGARTIFKYQNANGKRYRYLICGQQRKAAGLTGEKPCTGDLYPVDAIEQATLQVVQEAWQKPEAIAAAQAVYVDTGPASAQDAASLRRELTKLNKTLQELEEEESVAVKAQMAGIKAGASVEVYNKVFADIAARRQSITRQQEQVVAALASVPQEQEANSGMAVSKAVQKALEDAYLVLSNPDVDGVTKRDILMALVDKVVCHKDGVEVVFAPGLFESEGKDRKAEARDLNCYTTCIGIKTHR